MNIKKRTVYRHTHKWTLDKKPSFSKNMKAAAVAQNHEWQKKRELKNSNEKKSNSNTSDVRSALEKPGSLTYCNNT